MMNKLTLELVADRDSHYSRVTLVLTECNGSIRTECAYGTMPNVEADKVAVAALDQGLAVIRKRAGA